MKSTKIQLPQALAAWGTLEYPAILKAELEQLDPAALPLQEGIAYGSYVSSNPFHVMILAVSDTGDLIRTKAGIQYQSIIAGCSCADDPTPVDELSEYCEVEIVLHKATAAAQVSLLEE